MLSHGLEFAVSVDKLPYTEYIVALENTWVNYSRRSTKLKSRSSKYVEIV